MEEKKVFDHARIDAGITAVCKAMDDLDLTMLERWHVTKSVSEAAYEMLQSGMREAMEKREPEIIDIEAE